MKEISAGAVICTVEQTMLYYMIIKDSHGNYGFPKGHLEEGESLKQAALREIKEETGLDVKLLPRFEEVIEYTMPNGIDKEVHYFLSFFKEGEPVPQEGEVEEILILPFIKAYDLLTFDAAKAVLEKAHKLLLVQMRKVL